MRVTPGFRRGTSSTRSVLFGAAATTARTESIAFPAISTGVYGFPRERAAKIAVAEVEEWLQAGKQPSRIVLVAFDEETQATYRRLLSDDPFS